MNAFRFGLQSLLRNLRAGELSVLILAVVVAVSAMTAVGFFTDRVGSAIRSQASAVLAGDLEVSSPSPLDNALLAEGAGRGLETAEIVAFPTMATAPDSNSLAYIRAVTQGYPLRGELLISDELFGDTKSAAAIPAPGEAWAEPGLLGRMGIDVGTVLRIGEADVTVTQVLEYQPGQNMGGMAQLAPGLLVNHADLDAFNVVRPGSRVSYRQLYAGDGDTVDAWRQELNERVGEGARVRGLEDAGEQITAAIDRAQGFLNLASLVTVILSAVATAMAARRYALRNLDSIALIKSLGATQAFVQRVVLVQLTGIILGTAIVGSLLGYFGQRALIAIATEVLKVDLPPADPAAATLGLLTAATIIIGFALPHMLTLKDTSPIRVLRHDLPPPRLSTRLTYGVALAALVAMMLLIVRDLLLVLLIVAGLAAVAAAAVAIGWLLVRGFTRFRGAAGVAWRYGLANISRRGTESVVQIVAFAVGLMVLLLLSLVRSDLLNEWSASLPENIPNYFLINIEPEDWNDIDRFFADATGEDNDFLPFLRGRITSINGESVDDYRFPGERGERFARQETNLTWRQEFPATNELRSGEWWSDGTDDVIELSLEDEIAGELGLELGDRVGFDIGGESFEAKLTNTRFIQWDSMAPNFYVMLSPGLAEQLPQTYISSVYLPAEQRRLLNTFVRNFPGVTVLDLEVVLGQVRMVIDRASMAVQYVFLFTVLAGLVVLLAAIQVTRDERRFESAILHTLGADRRTILQGVAVEFTTLGGLSGVLAAFGATLVGWLLATRVFQLDYGFSPWIWVLGCVAGSVIVGVTGTLATRRAVNEPPVTVLRET